MEAVKKVSEGAVYIPKHDDPRLHLVLERYAARCLKYDLNAIIAIVGEPGTGKSSLAIRMGEILRDKYGFDFSVNNIFFDLASFLDAVGSKHSVFIIDEAGVQLFSRNFMTEVNKVFAYITQTIRFKNSVIIFTLPHLRFLDKSARTLLTNVWKTDAIIMRDGTIKREATVYKVRTDYISDSVRLVVDTYKNDRGGKEELKGLIWSMPDEVTWAEYQRRKEMFWRIWANDWSTKIEKALGIKRSKKGEKKKRIIELIENNPEWKKILFNPFTKWSKERAEIVKKIAKEVNSPKQYVYEVLMSLGVRN